MTNYLERITLRLCYDGEESVFEEVLSLGSGSSSPAESAFFLSFLSLSLSL